ncbi:hypothetical protein BD779DRAFT_1630406 [Infundibulicybe gibba]|nr:hypothetical protein BD779DRAFT_1630406 [Infundibulicybe gibba]
MLPRSLGYITSLFFILLFVRAQAPPPPAVPLAIRSPHFNCWQPGSVGNWPSFWNGRILGWLGYINIDGVTWEWLGGTKNNSTLVKTEITATRTIFTFSTGPMELEVTFLSPIEPTDLVRQSFPFTYMYLTAKATDGANHSVQVYTDITAEWVSGDQHTNVTWSTTPSNNLVFHQTQSASPSPMQEIKDQAEDATVYYAMANSPNMTWQTGAVALRDKFQVVGGRLNNTEDKGFRAISNNWPVFAFSMDVGSISEISTPIVWALGVVRDPTIRYAAGDGSTQQRSSFFWTQYSTIGDAIGAFIKDFPNARQRAMDLDQRIASDASSISQDYSDLVSLSVRQTMGGIDITTSKGSDGQWNASDIMIFMKSVGDASRRVNPTELMFAAFPAYLYLNASWAGFLLRSSLQHQAAAVSTSAYAIPNLGSTYPSAPGNTSIASTEALAIESSGDMIVMALAHAQLSGDGSLISSYYSLLKNWANYLAANALNQTKFITADGQNNPNLAIKGIIGIRAMGEISQIVGQVDDASRFKDQASTMLQDLESQAILSSRIISTYGQSTSWGLIYNLFSDRLLKLEFINQSIYSDQTAFYATQISAGGQFGIAYDSNVPNQVKSHWTMLTAATTTDNETRDDLVSSIHSRAWFINSTAEFPTDYNAVSGAVIGTGGRSSPAQGAMFAFLALDLPERMIQAPAPNPGGGGNSTSNSNSRPNVGAIVGGTLASAFIIGLAGLFLLLWMRRRKRETAATPDPFSLHLNTPGAVKGTHTHKSYPRGKGHHSSNGGHMVHPTSTFIPTHPSTLDVMAQHSESNTYKHPHSLSSDSVEPSMSPITPSAENPPDSRPALGGAKRDRSHPCQ